MLLGAGDNPGQGKPPRPVRLHGDPSHRRAWYPCPSPAALLGSGSFSLLRFQFISSDGPSVPLTYNPSFYSITGLWFWTATPPLVDPVLVKLSAKALWSPLVRELWTFCSCPTKGIRGFSFLHILSSIWRAFLTMAILTLSRLGAELELRRSGSSLGPSQ